jgi:trans-aconitate 2-methyltransferase
MAWDPDTYLAHEAHRLRPAFELLERVGMDPAPKRVADLGCGTGNSTALLCARYPQAEVLGVDGDGHMLERAQSSAVPACWQEADLATWAPEETFDLLFSSAAFQWVESHERIFPALFEGLSPGGVLAIQMPRNFAAPSHRLLREVAAEGPWADRLAPLAREAPVAAPDVYYRLFRPLTAALDIWETEYCQVLKGPDPVLHWVSGTALVPYRAALSDAPGLEEAFLSAYRDALRDAYPAEENGETLFPFKRLFLIARKEPGLPG